MKSKKTKKTKEEINTEINVEVKNYDVAARLEKVASYDNKKEIEPKTTLDEIKLLSNKRSKLSGELMRKIAFGPRAQGKEEIKKEIENINKKIKELKEKKVEEDKRGR